MPPNGKIVVDDHLPRHAVDVQLDHVLAGRIVDWNLVLVLRVDDVCDELLVEPSLVLGGDSQRSDKTAIGHDSLLDAEAVDVFNHFWVGADFIWSGPAGERLDLLRRHAELAVLVRKGDRVIELLSKVTRHKRHVLLSVD